MKFLTKFAQVAGRIAQAIGIFGPLAQTYTNDRGDRIIQTMQDSSLTFSKVILDVELSGQALQLPGPQKLIAAAPNMANAVLGSAAFVGKKIANPELFRQGATKIADGWADCTNALDADEVEKMVVKS